MDTIQYLEEHGLEIGQAATAGDTAAQRIIDMYRLHYAQPSDPGAKGLLDVAVSEYQQSR